MRPEMRSADSGRRRSASGKIAAIMLEISGEPGLTLTDVARRTGLPARPGRCRARPVPPARLDRGGPAHRVRPGTAAMARRSDERGIDLERAGGGRMTATSERSLPE